MAIIRFARRILFVATQGTARLDLGPHHLISLHRGVESAAKSEPTATCPRWLHPLYSAARLPSAALRTPFGCRCISFREPNPGRTPHCSNAPEGRGPKQPKARRDYRSGASTGAGRGGRHPFPFFSHVSLSTGGDCHPIQCEWPAWHMGHPPSPSTFDTAIRAYLLCVYVVDTHFWGACCRRTSPGPWPRSPDVSLRTDPETITLCASERETRRIQATQWCVTPYDSR